MYSWRRILKSPQKWKTPNSHRALDHFLLQEAMEGKIRKNKQLLACIIEDEFQNRHKNEEILI